ncbi:MAG: PhzF family phenazine biosynthesis isomerase [Chthoniobacterales bacterium]
MKIPYFEVLAFTDRLFAGNAAGVCILEEWLPDEMLQKIATENNLAETAFFIDRGSFFDIRWLSPSAEIDLCGHATVGSAHVLFQHLGRSGNSLVFQSRSSGELRVDREGERLVLDFPSRSAAKCDAPALLAESLGAEPSEVSRNRDYIAVFERQEQVAALAPNLVELAKLEGAPGRLRHRAGKGLRFRLPLFCAERRRSGRFGDRFDPLRVDSVLGEAARQNEIARAPAFPARGRAVLRRSRRPGRDRWHGRDLRPGHPPASGQLTADHADFADEERNLATNQSVLFA